MPAQLGAAQGLCGIPSLLISDLGNVKDPVVQRALYQVQNFCNSIGATSGVTTGTGTATLGSIYPGTFTVPAFWAPVTYKGAKAWMPVWV